MREQDEDCKSEDRGQLGNFIKKERVCCPLKIPAILFSVASS